MNMNFTFTQAKRFRRDSSGEDDIEDEDSCEEELAGDLKSSLKIIFLYIMQIFRIPARRCDSQEAQAGEEDSRSRQGQDGVHQEQAAAIHDLLQAEDGDHEEGLRAVRPLRLRDRRRHLQLPQQTVPVRQL